MSSRSFVVPDHLKHLIHVDENVGESDEAYDWRQPYLQKKGQFELGSLVKIKGYPALAEEVKPYGLGLDDNSTILKTFENNTIGFIVASDVRESIILCEHQLWVVDNIFLSLFSAPHS